MESRVGKTRRRCAAASHRSRSDEHSSLGSLPSPCSLAKGSYRPDPSTNNDRAVLTRPLSHDASSPTVPREFGDEESHTGNSVDLEGMLKYFAFSGLAANTAKCYPLDMNQQSENLSETMVASTVASDFAFDHSPFGSSESAPMTEGIDMTMGDWGHLDMTTDQRLPVQLTPQSVLDVEPSYKHTNMSKLQTPEMRATEHDETCITACAKIMELLEARANEGLCQVDEVLRLNKDTLAKLRLLSNREDFHKSFGSLLLFVGAVQQVASLFNAACLDLRGRRQPLAGETISGAPVLEGDQTRKHSSPSQTPSILFGSFSLDVEEQTILRAQIVRREMRRAIVDISKLKQTVTTTLRCNVRCNLIENLLGDVIRSMESLMSQIDNECI